MPASGSLWSSVNDLLTFLSFSLGEQDSPLRSAMLLQRTPGRALGWGASRLGGETVYQHEGGEEGYRSAAIFNAQTRTGVVVLMNARTEDSPLALAWHLLFSGSPLQPATVAPARPRLVTLTSAALDAYSGEYQLDATHRLRVARKRGHLLVDAPGDGIGVFLPTSDRDFIAKTEDQRLAFEKDHAGFVTALVLYSAGQERRAVRLSTR